MCDSCTQQGQHVMCPPCRERTGDGFRFTRDAWTVEGLTRHAWQCFKRDWAVMLGVMAIFAAITTVLVGGQLLGQFALFGTLQPTEGLALDVLAYSTATTVVSQMVMYPFMVGFFVLCMDVLRARPTEFGMLFVPFARFGKVLPAAIIAGLPQLAFNAVTSVITGILGPLEGAIVVAAVTVGALPALIYVGIGWGFAPGCLAQDPELGGVDALRRSWRMVDGRRWSIILVWIVSSLLILAGCVPCLLGLPVVAPLTSLLWVGSYLALATPNREPAALHA